MGTNYRRFKNIFFDFLSRLFISLIFVFAIPSKILNFSQTTNLIVSKGFPEYIAQILLVFAIMFLILGSGFFVFSRENNLGAIFLLIFLIPTTVIFHISPFQQKQFLINLALIGSFLLSIIRKLK